MREYFSKQNFFRGDVKVEVDLSNYATKADLKNATGIYTWHFAKKFDLASLKTEIDKLDVGRWETFPVDLSKLTDLVKNEVVKKTYMMN